MDAVLEAPFRAAVTTAVWAVATVPAVAEKVAVVVPAATAALDGTVSVCALLASDTVTPDVPAAWFKVRVHVDVEPLVRPAGAQETEVTCAGAASVTDAVCELPL
jgi:hypothetical protein